MGEDPDFTVLVYCDQKPLHADGKNRLIDQIRWQRVTKADGNTVTRLSTMSPGLQRIPTAHGLKLPDNAHDFMSEYTIRTLEAVRLRSRAILECAECNLRAEMGEQRLSQLVDDMRRAGESMLTLRALVAILDHER